AGFQLGNDQLPKEFAGPFIQAHQKASISLVTMIAWRIIIGAEKNFSPCHNRHSIGLASKFRRPMHIPAFAQVDWGLPNLTCFEPLRETFLGGVHVTAKILSTPRGPILMLKKKCPGSAFFLFRCFCIVRRSQ